MKSASAPKTIVGITITMLVPPPKGFAAISAAKVNQRQSSLKLVLISALASNRLSIPIIAAFEIFFNLPHIHNISDLNMTLMYLTFL